MPPDAVQAEAYDDQAGAMAWIAKSSLRQKCSFRERVQALAEEFPLLDGASVQYWEVRESDIHASGLSCRDQANLKAVFTSHPAGVLPYADPILMICPDRLVDIDADTTIRHELVHLEQMVRGDTLLVPGAQIWKGERYAAERTMAINAAVSKKLPGALYPYLSLPWEREAFIRTEGEEAYRNKLRQAYITLHINELLPAHLGRNPESLATTLGSVLLMLEDVEPVESLEVSPSGMMIATVLNEGNLGVAEPVAEMLWMIARSRVKPDLQSGELLTSDQAWSVLIGLACVVEDEYSVEADSIEGPA